MAAQFWSSSAASQKKRKRTAGTNIDYHDDGGGAGPSRIIRHFNFVGPRTGLPSARSAHFNVPASPTKQPSNINPDAHGDDGDEEFQNDGFGFTPLDPFASFGGDDDDDDLEYHIQALDLAAEPTRARRARVSPLHTWKEDERESFLLELMRACGRGDAQEQDFCLGHGCTSSEYIYRCRDCVGRGLFCRACIVKEHAENPLHRIEKWEDECFQRVTLRSLGLHIQLNHCRGEECINPVTPNGGRFVIIDVHAVHEVNIFFCGCAKQPSGGVCAQLLRARLFPATSTYPKTAATFACLERYQLLSFECRCSLFGYYYSISRGTDNTTGTLMSDIENEKAGRKLELDRYSEFRDIVRMWADGRMGKRGGRGNSQTGMKGTQPGELAVQCAACPIPGLNLPDGWQNSTNSWIYTLFLAIDANFRLQRKTVSSWTRDPALSDGLAYLVERDEMNSYLRSYDAQAVEKNTCSGHKAVIEAESRKSAGLAATGLVSTDCSRHDCKRPLSSADLTAGEQYRFTDYTFYSGLRNQHEIQRLVVSYDIVCQWSVNIWNRISNIPRWLRLDDENTDIVFLVPKFHLPAHVPACQAKYSYNHALNVARTDGEAPERLWRYLDSVATMLREMGPGSRVDFLNGFMADWNWKKNCSLDSTMLRKIRSAAPECRQQCEAHRRLEESLDPEDVRQWRSEVKAWEQDRTLPSPFAHRVESLTQASVRRRLAEAEDQEVAAGAVLLHGEVSPFSLIAQGIDLEEQQRRLIGDESKLGPNSTDTQRTAVLRRSTVLRNKIKTFQEAQALYCPGAAALRLEAAARIQEGSPAIPAHAIPLWLPSDIGRKKPCDKQLMAFEWELRLAQAYDALSSLRYNLHYLSSTYKSKDRFSRGQHENTRSNSLIADIKAKGKSIAQRYRQARKALLSLEDVLQKDTGWKADLQVLNEKDIRPMAVDERLNVSEGRRLNSWLWSARGVSSSADMSLQDSLRLEWCKSRARAMRWSEELELLNEERRRVLQTFECLALIWDGRARNKFDSDDRALAEGRSAFAWKQARMFRAIQSRCAQAWHDVPTYLGLFGDRFEDGESVRAIFTDIEQEHTASV